MKPSGATYSWDAHHRSKDIDPTEAALCGHSTTSFHANDAEAHVTNPICYTENEKPVTVESNQMRASASATEMLSFQNSKSAMPCFSGRECIDIDFLYQVRWQCNVT